MEKKNEIISVFQYVILGTFIGTSMYEGTASVFLFFNASHDSWIATILSLIIGFIPLFLIIKIINYEPTKNIIDKINTLFTKKLAFIVNFLLALYVFILFSCIDWTIVNFTALKYLTETPEMFIAFILIVPTLYMTYKGIATICRSSEILFYIIFFFYVFVTIVLSKYINIENLKPFLSSGFLCPLKESIHFLCYTIFPFIILTIIPKSNIKDNHKLTKYLVFSYSFTLLINVLITFVIETVIGVDLAKIYRYPSYYVHKKILIASVIENVENFTTTHWIFSMFMTSCLCLHYLYIYFNQLFHIKKEKFKLVFLIFPIILSTIFILKTFYNVNAGLNFINKTFSSVFTIGLFIIIIILNISIFLKKMKKIK
ncbi:MAG: endospore germination permease [Bacilli bacterium]|nr:endospore germination permease [Bacilli bacterium]